MAKQRKSVLGTALLSETVTAEKIGLSTPGRKAGKVAKREAPPKLTTPFRGLLPDLTPDEREALRESIKADGVRVPVLVDQHGRVLDGHHRLALDPHAPRRVVNVATDAEAQAVVMNANLTRRNLTAEQRARITDRLKVIARALRREGKTQAVAARHIGVPRATLAMWERKAVTKDGASKAIRKASAKVDAETRRAIVRKVKAGQPVGKVAFRYGVTHGRVSQLVKAAGKPKPRKAAKRGRRIKCPYCKRSIKLNA